MAEHQRRSKVRGCTPAGDLRATRPQQAAPEPDRSQAHFERALLPLRRELHSSARRLTRSGSEAEDLVQEAVLRAWRSWGRLPAGSNTRAWAHRILYNTFVTHYHHVRRERALLEDHACEQAHIQLHALLRAVPTESLICRIATVDEAFRSLPRELQHVLRSVDVEERSYQEAASALDCPIGTIMSRLHRGRRMLRQRLASFSRQRA
ncbi:MAG: sigma-70 family RNA polymerase sigma factor [Polyangiales bacterium]